MSAKACIAQRRVERRRATRMDVVTEMPRPPVVSSERIVHAPAVQAGGDANAIEDIAVLRSLASGDKQALGVLYDRHAGMMLALGVRIIGVRREAEDLLHDVFLEAWHHAQDYAPERGTVRAWLVVRARSRALDRRAKNVRQAPLPEGRAEIAADAPGVDASDGERVRRGVAALPAELTAIVELAYYEGLSSSQIAAKLGVPIGTVKSRMARAVAFLRERLLPPAGETTS